MIAFNHNLDGLGEIIVMDLKGVLLFKLPNIRAWNACPEWSPDGGKIGFLSSNGPLGSYDLFLYDPQLDSIRQLTTSSDLLYCGMSLWSPDGTHLVYAANRNANIDIFSFDLDNGMEKRMTFDPAVDSSPAWSPDGSQIVFKPQREGGNDIYSLTVDGMRIKRLTQDSNIDQSPTWSPDGRSIAYFSYNEVGKEISLVDSEGCGITHLTSSFSTVVGRPAWAGTVGES